MSPDIQVEPQILRTAVREAQSAANSVGAARQAAGAALPDNAFGFMCSPLFLPMYSIVATGADALMKSASDSILRAASGLATVADDFEQTDRASKQALEALS